MSKILYIIPKKQEADRFLAQRIRNWLLHPETDEQLTQDILVGKYPALKFLIEQK